MKEGRGVGGGGRLAGEGGAGHRIFAGVSLSSRWMVRHGFVFVESECPRRQM